jgi:hypothetical protein
MERPARKMAGPVREFPTRGRHFSKRACKPNSVVCGHSSRRRVTADAHQRPTRRFRHLLEPPVAYRADTPRRLVLEALASPSLFGLAPCGVYPARCLTAAAVRSYRTFSPLPRRAGSKLLAGCLRRPGKGRKRVAEAVFSLWHWPSRSLDAAIPDVIRHTALRSSDFPPPMHSPALRLAKLRQRPHGSLAIVILPAFEISELALNLSAATPGGLLLSLRAPLRRSCCSICVGRRSRPPAL